MGEPTGEKPLKPCWKGPAELRMGSSEREKLDVSMVKGTWGCGVLNEGVCSEGWSRA